MVIQTRITLEEFKDFIAKPENSSRLFELINGEIVEVVPGRTRYSEIGHVLSFTVRLFCQEHNLPCHTSGEAGAYHVGDNVVAPDFAYKRTPMSDDYPDPIAPDWAVEVISPTDKATNIREKRQIYRQAGLLLWEIYPQSQSIDVYAPGQPVRTVTVDGTLDGDEVLPGFTISARRLFEG